MSLARRLAWHVFVRERGRSKERAAGIDIRFIKVDIHFLYFLIPLGRHHILDIEKKGIKALVHDSAGSLLSLLESLVVILRPRTYQSEHHSSELRTIETDLDFFVLFRQLAA